MNEQKKTSKTASEDIGREDKQEGVRLRIDGREIKTHYANICNVSSTPEEVILSFGINTQQRTNDGDLLLQMHSRIILSPFAAKRLAIVLGQSVKAYESKFGPLELDARKRVDEDDSAKGNGDSA